jgi:uncharacterized protein
VIEAATPENAKQATEALAAKLSERRDVLKAVSVAGGGDLFQRNGLLYLSKEELASATSGLTSAQPLLGRLATDLSLRGVLDALLLVTTGVQRGQAQADDLVRPLTLASDTLDRVPSCGWRCIRYGSSSPVSSASSSDLPRRRRSASCWSERST